MKSYNQIIKEAESFDHKDKLLIKSNGVVFTEKKICDKIIKMLSPQINDRICEPSVGKGIFVFSLLEYFRNNNHSTNEIIHFIENNLFCYDISQNFITSFKENLNFYVNLIGYHKNLDLKNIKCEDYLKTLNNYDITLGNPPYIRIQNIDDDYLKELKIELTSLQKGNVDLYYAFIEKSLIESKKIGYIIPNSFIKTKSGKNLREILLNRVTHIYDNRENKIWRKISTYTCILICDQNESTDLIYETKNERKIFKKSELNQNFWNFGETKKTTESLKDLFYRCSGGLATLKDDIYKIQKYDELFCYIDDNPIEYGICKKLIKATKHHTIEDHGWIIYPYDESGLPINEEKIMQEFPLAYSFFLSKRKVLENRDKGKGQNYKCWYCYGRTQGLIKEKKGVQVILPITFLKSKGINFIEIPKDENYLILSGILVEVKEDSLLKFYEKINSKEFYDYCESKNKILRDKENNDDIWLQITTTTLREFLY